MKHWNYAISRCKVVYDENESSSVCYQKCNGEYMPHILCHFKKEFYISPISEVKLLIKFAIQKANIF